MVDATGIEPVTPSMSTRGCPAELRLKTGVPPFRAGGRRGYNDNRRDTQARPQAAAIIRSTSETISRRWIGLDSTFAPGGAVSLAARATAAKPVMNMIRRPG